MCKTTTKITGHASNALSEEENSVITAVQLLPKCVSKFVKLTVSSISCGPSFTCVSTTTGSVYSWGEGGSGQLGCGRVKKQSIPKLVLEKDPKNGAKFKEVCCGWGHTMALTEEGDLYSWGLNPYGQLGIGDTKPRYEPICITPEDAPQPLSFASCKAFQNYSLGLTSEGEMWAWGCNSNMQLGLGDDQHRFQPTFVHSLKNKKISNIASR